MSPVRREWLGREARRILKLLVCAFIAQKLLMRAPAHILFPSIFVIVYLLDNVHRFLWSNKERPIFLEEVAVGILVYAVLGLVAWWMDHQMAVYTQRHAGPVIPGVLVAILDKAWPSPRPLGRRR